MADVAKTEPVTDKEKTPESWVNTKWRPTMGWLYMVTCAFDFVVAPISWAILQASLQLPIKQWDPITLQGAGLYHLAMGAVLGVAAWSRGQEKMASMPSRESKEVDRPLERVERPERPARRGD